MNFDDLYDLFINKKKIFGENIYHHISEILTEAKEIHRKDWLINPTRAKDHEQSWRAFKGKNFEKLIVAIINDEVTNLGLKVIKGDKLDSIKLSKELSQVKRNVSVNFGEFGLQLPDIDIVIYNPESLNILAVLSCKTTLRERIAQTGYWKLKFLQDDITKNIHVFFITPDEDGTLTVKHPCKKGRSIVEVDTDGAYVMTSADIEESLKVKTFDKFLSDLEILNKKTKVNG